MRIGWAGTGEKVDTMDRMDEVRSFIKDNIDYDGLLQYHLAEKGIVVSMTV